jgi:poly(beta-D-mannuronate) lyase
MRQKRMLLTVRSLIFCAVLSCGSLTAHAADLPVPFSLRDPATITQRPIECNKMPEPVLALELPSKYGDDGPERDDVDEEADKAFEAAMKPVRAYQSLAVRQANRFTERGRSGDGRCAIALLAQWASANALSDMRNNTAVFKLATTLSALSIAYLQVRALASEEEKTRIGGWLAASAERIRTNFGERTSESAAFGNHRAWAGLAVAAAGLAANRGDLVEWGLASHEAILCHAEPDGALPLEIRRGKKARDYHIFALSPLTLLAEIGVSQGRASYELCDRAMGRIITFTFAAIADPAKIAEMAEVEQALFPDEAPLPPTNRLAFMEPYLKRFPGAVPQAEAILASRPLKSTDLGGDMTLLFGLKK